MAVVKISSGTTEATAALGPADVATDTIAVFPIDLSTLVIGKETVVCAVIPKGICVGTAAIGVETCFDGLTGVVFFTGGFFVSTVIVFGAGFAVAFAGCGAGAHRVIGIGYICVFHVGKGFEFYPVYIGVGGGRVVLAANNVQGVNATDVFKLDGVGFEVVPAAGINV